MKVHVRLRVFGRTDPVWPDGWPPPRVGDEVALGTDPDYSTVHKVEQVQWTPEGEEPAVYVVLGPSL